MTCREHKGPNGQGQSESRVEYHTSECHASGSSSGARVLLVDDNASIRAMAVMYLHALGYQTVEVGTGEEGVQVITNAAFDLVLMDVRLPGIDGLETTRRIRALDGCGPDVPIIGVTASDHSLKRQSCLAAGMNDVIDKVALVTALPDLLRRHIIPAAPAAAQAS